MTDEQLAKYKEFLALDDIKKYEYLFGRRLKIGERLTLKWWILLAKMNPRMRSWDLFESVRKGRF